MELVKLPVLLLLLWFLSTRCVINGLDYCIDPSKIGEKVGGTTTGIQLLDKSIRHFGSMGLMECAGMCKRQSLCLSINWSKDDCELNFAYTGTFISSEIHIFADMQQFPPVIAKGCQEIACPTNALCVEFETGVHCEVIGCNNIPYHDSNIDIDSFNRRVLWEFNENVTFPCLPLYRPSVNVTCGIDGHWTEFDCLPISSCQEVANCNSTAASNEYWIYINTLYETMKIFCKIEPGTLASEYITLHQNNSASTPVYKKGQGCERVDDGLYYSTVGSSTFSKVKWRTITMTAALISPYIQSFMANQNFGNAADCFATDPPDICGVIGNFEIDLRGTGFKVSNVTTWESKSNGHIQNITRSHNDSVVVGYCGGEINGVCGGCKPLKNKLYLAYNQWDIIPLFEAKKPSCQYAIL